jgi:dethiobiotin synthetase
MRLFVTGTDTNVGKTRVTAALARAFVMGGEWPTIVKLVQTGLAGNAPGDAAEAGALAGCPFVELARFARSADPWSASLAAQCEPLDAATLAGRLDAFADPLIVEGAGGAAVPLNPRESLADVAAATRLWQWVCGSAASVTRSSRSTTSWHAASWCGASCSSNAGGRWAMPIGRTLARTHRPRTAARRGRPRRGYAAQRCRSRSVVR